MWRIRRGPDQDQLGWTTAGRRRGFDSRHILPIAALTSCPDSEMPALVRASAEIATRTERNGRTLMASISQHLLELENEVAYRGHEIYLWRHRWGIEPSPEELAELDALVQQRDAAQIAWLEAMHAEEQR